VLEIAHFVLRLAQYEIMKTAGCKKMRFRSMEDVIGEINSLRNNFDVAHFIDDDMLPNYRRAKEFIKLWQDYDLVYARRVGTVYCAKYSKYD
jgi:hypothetical protein